MMRKVLGVAVGGATILAIGSAGAQAYFTGGGEFELRGGAASVSTQLQLGPLEQAIRDALDGWAVEGELIERDLAGVIAFYQARGYQPAWTAEGVLNDTALAAIERIEAAAADGLDPTAYATPAVDFGTVRYETSPWGLVPLRPSSEDVAAAEIAVSLAVAAYTREAYAGRVVPSTVASDIDVEPHYPNTTLALAKVSTSDDPAAALNAYNPTHAGYIALRDELARIRGGEAQAQVVVPDGPSLRLGDEDERVAILRARLELPMPEDETAHVYDETVATAVREFQQTAGLVSDGIVGPNTLGALNGPAIDPEAELIANMERWRWLPRDLGDYYVNVNVPEFMVRIIDQGDVIHETRVVVGQRSNRTPIFSDEMEHLIVNPFWYVPASIVAAEYMPVLRSDPGYFVRNNYDVFARWNGSVQQVNPYQVDWSQLSASQVSMRQRPGAGNALGRIKFMFPNGHAVYLHDTPSKSLFQRDVRAFSHGCVRVMNPMEFADSLLSHEPDWDAARLETLYGNSERQVDLTNHIPVHITYFTAVADEDGSILYKNDIYGHGARLIELLGLQG